MTDDEIDKDYYVNVAELMPQPLPRPTLKIIKWSSGEDP